MWAAYLTDVVDQTGSFAYRITYSDGERKFDKTYTASNLSLELIRQTARNEVTALAAVVESKVNIDWQVGAEIDIATPAPVIVDIDPVIKAQSDWFVKFRELQSLLTAANAGLIGADDARIASLVDELKASMKDSYLEML